MSISTDEAGESLRLSLTANPKTPIHRRPCLAILAVLGYTVDFITSNQVFVLLCCPLITSTQSEGLN
jgi:hypothetical protein